MWRRIVNLGIGPLFKCSPFSTRTVIAIIEAEAFAFISEDLKFVAFSIPQAEFKNT